MDDIWDKKPEPVWVPRGYSSTSKIKEDDVQMIILEDETAWLEKLQEEYDELNGNDFVYFSILNEITKHIENYPNEKDDKKYSYSGDIGPKFNSVLFLTHLET